MAAESSRAHTVRESAHFQPLVEPEQRADILLQGKHRCAILSRASVQMPGDGILLRAGCEMIGASRRTRMNDESEQPFTAGRTWLAAERQEEQDRAAPPVLPFLVV